MAEHKSSKGPGRPSRGETSAVNVRIDADLKARLDQFAEARGISVRQAVELAIQSMIEGQTLNDQFSQDQLNELLKLLDQSKQTVSNLMK